MQNTYIVTGGAGFIGNNLVRRLNAQGCEAITIVDRLDHDGKRRNLEDVRYREYVDKDDFRARVRSDAVAPVECVCHLGACSATTELDEDYLRDNNFEYSRELCLWSLEHGARFVYASSAATYGDGSLGYSDRDDTTRVLQPLNPYGRSKQMFDLWALDEGLFDRIVGLKYFNVYGPHESHKGDMRSVVEKAFRQVRDTERIELFKSYRPEYADGEQVRDFVYARDAVEVTLFFADPGAPAGLFNCGTGRARSWLDLARAVFAAMDREPHIAFIDMPAALRERYQYHTQADTDKLRAAGYSAPFTSLEDGVRDYVQRFLARESGNV